MNQCAAIESRFGARQARLVVIEEGSPVLPLVWSADGPETTIVVGPADCPSPSLAHRIDRRMVETEQSGQAIGEVVFVLAARGGERLCCDRLSALLTMIGHLNSAPQMEITLVLPADAPTEVRHEVFALAEVVIVELAAGPNVRIRFVSNTPEPHESGFFSSVRAVATAETSEAPLPIVKAAEATSRLSRSAG